MATLNWRTRHENGETKVRVEKHPRFETELFWSLNSTLLEELRTELARSFEEKVELKIDLPDGWTLYFKVRASGLSHIQVAHPAEHEWVGTLTLSAEHARALTQAMGGLEKNLMTLRVSEYGPTSGIINFSLVLERL